jgi:hypothetical protein
MDAYVRLTSGEGPKAAGRARPFEVRVQRCGGRPCDCPAEERLAATPLQLLALQRSAGNAAAVALLGRRSPPTQRLTVSRQTDADIVAAGAEQPAWLGSMKALNLLLHQKFPAEEGRLYSGCSSGTGTGVSADLAGGRDGYVMLVVGTDYGTGTTVATLPARVAELRRVLVQAMLWRLSTGFLTQADLAFPEVDAALRATEPVALRKLLASRGVDQPARDTVGQLLAISTPVSAGATLRADGSATEKAGDVVVRLMPDERAGTRTHTEISFVPARVAVPSVLPEGGRVKAILGPLPVPPEVRVRTTYAATGPKSADPITASSGYGTGTAPADKAAGHTSLRFHEGSHGLAAVQYFRDHRFRPFTGAVGMTMAAWLAEAHAFVSAHDAWANGAVTASLCKVDCVGSPTIDQFSAAEQGYVQVCTPCVVP